MMPRFLLGLVLGAAAAGLVYALVPGSLLWLGVGVVVACLVWFGRYVDLIA